MVNVGKINKTTRSQVGPGFSLAEALVTLMIVSLVLAAVLPVVSKKTNTVESMWRFASNNSDIYFGNGDSQTLVLGSNSAPVSSAGSKLVVVAPESSDAVSNKPLMDFYQKTSSGTKNIGRISFGENSSAVGYNALYKNSASDNSAFGSTAMYYNTNGKENTAFGSNALAGYKSGRSVDNTGNCNTASGFSSLYSNTIGFNNTASGHSSLYFNTTGSENVAVGYYALYSNIDGIGNVAVGDGALQGNFSGHRNTSIGTSTLGANYTGINNVALGGAALANSRTGDDNTALGRSSLFLNYSGIQNTAVGSSSCNTISAGNKNVCLGYQSGPTVDTSNKLYIDVSRRDDPLIWGDFYNRDVKLNSTLTVTKNIYLSAAPIVSSDSRIKSIGSENKEGLEKVLKIKVKNYKYKGVNSDNREHMGVIAQELKKDMPNAVVEGPGKEGYKSLLYIDSNEILFSCVNAIKQLYSKIVANTNRINVLEEKLKQKDKQVENLEDQIREINKRLYTIQTKQK